MPSPSAFSPRALYLFHRRNNRSTRSHQLLSCISSWAHNIFGLDSEENKIFLFSNQNSNTDLPIIKTQLETMNRFAPLRSLRRLAASSETSWSKQMSFASPESDFAAASLPSPSTATATTRAISAWSGQLTFASAESDFTQSNMMKDISSSRSLSTSSLGQLWSQTLSFASPESDFTTSWFQATESTRLPQTFAEALMEEKRAVVVTTAASPHRIVHVNAAWEGLCGYSRSEALDRTLSLIQGPDTNSQLASSTVQKVLSQQQVHDAYLINYGKDGRRFVNHLSMGLLSLEGENNFLVGVLEEVQAEDVPLRMVSY
jgi:PAS domain S-box-containing protein